MSCNVNIFRHLMWCMRLKHLIYPSVELQRGKVGFIWFFCCWDASSSNLIKLSVSRAYVFNTSHELKMNSKFPQSQQCLELNLQKLEYFHVIRRKCFEKSNLWLLLQISHVCNAAFVATFDIKQRKKYEQRERFGEWIWFSQETFSPRMKFKNEKRRRKSWKVSWDFQDYERIKMKIHEVSVQSESEIWMNWALFGLNG